MVDLASRLAGHATATALLEHGDRITYAELSDRVLRTAAALRAYGLADGARVAVAAASTTDGVVGYLGVQAAGLLPVMLSPRSPLAELHRRYDEVDPATPTTIYVKEDAVVPGLDRWLAQLFDDEHIDHTSDVLAGAAEPDPEWEARQAELEAKVRDCDRRLAKYHKALDLTDEVEPFIEWIAEVKRERRQIEAKLGRSIPGEKLTKEQIRALIRELRNVVRVLADADPADKAELYAEMGVSLTYHPNGRVAVEALPRVRDVSVEGPERWRRRLRPSRSRSGRPWCSDGMSAAC